MANLSAYGGYSRVISSKMEHFTARKSRHIKNLEPDFDSIKIEQALEQQNIPAISPRLRGATRQTSAIPLRSYLAFKAVNRNGTRGYDPGVQRHHLLPCVLLSRLCFAQMLGTIGRDRLGFDDFRLNGLLLPTNDAAVLRMGLPLHRGPHPAYNALVIERVGQVEAGWSDRRWRNPEAAQAEAEMRLALLQRALRRRLLDQVRKRLTLNRHDPLAKGIDFTELDAMTEALWPATADVEIPTASEGDHPFSALAALSTARTEAVATSSSMPTPQITAPSGPTHST